jgi:hypothetical protein
MQYVHITESTETQIQWPQKMNKLHTNNSWVLEWYGSIFLSTSHNAQSATMWNVHHHEYVHTSWQWVWPSSSSSENVHLCQHYMPYQQNIFHSRIGKFSAMKMCHEQNILSHQIRTFSPYCLRSIPQYATGVERSVSRHQTNKLLHPAIISCAATDYAC